MLVTNPIVNNSSGSIASLPIASGGNFAPLTGGDPPDYQPLDVSALVITNGIGTIAYTATSWPLTIATGTQTYTYTLNPSPTLGQFTVVGGQLIINLGTSTLPPIVSFTTQPAGIPTTFVAPPYPSILTSYAVSGELTWTMTFEEQPTGQFKFTALATNRAAIIAALNARPNFNVYGCALTPSNIGITEVSRSVSDPPLIEVTISLTGIHADKLDVVVAPNLPTTPASCLAPIPPVPAPTSAPITIQQLATLAGTAISGALVMADLALATDRTARTTLSTQLNSNRVRVAEGFLDYTRSGAIAIVPYNSVTTHQLLRVINKVQTTGAVNINGFAKLYDPPSKLIWGSNSLPPAAPSTVVSPPPPPPTTTNTIVEGDVFPSISPYPLVNKDLSIVFDISGKRKRKKVTQMQLGQPISETEEEWGFVAVGRDHIQFDSSANPTIINITGSWQRIVYKTTTYTYNADRYLISRQTTGSMLARYRVENAQNPESLKVRIDPVSPDPVEVAKLQTYRFFSVPLTQTETYRLDSLAPYYLDIQAPQIRLVNCLPDGTSVELTIDDPDWIAPYYVKTKTYREDAIATTPNPESTNLKPLPDLTTGISRESIERVQIVENPPTLGSLTSYQDNYIKTIDNYGASGAQFNANLNIGESQFSSGRPPLASQRQLPPISAPATAPSIGSPPVTATGIKSGVDPRYASFAGVEGTIDYPNAATMSEAVAAATLDLNIYNFKNGIRDSFTCDFRPQIRPGDRVEYLVNSYRIGRVISATNRLRIEGATLITSLGTELTVGMETIAPVSTFAVS